MGMKRTNFYFSDKMLARLKEAKEKTDMSVSAIIRAAIEAYLKEMGI